MKCAKCNENAAIRMRHHHMALCKTHYISWFLNQTLTAVDKYRMFPKTAKILVAVSGGKDSLTLWEVLNQLGYQCDGVHINLGIDEGLNYSRNSEEHTRTFATRRNLNLILLDLQNRYNESLPQIAYRIRGRASKPCSVCGVIKRHLMNQAALDGKYDVLVTGHNLDDEASVLLANVLSWDANLLNRQYPLLEEDMGFVKKAKPFCRFYERETTAYALLKKIVYVEDECPFSQDSKQLYYKEILNHMEEDQPGVKTRFYSTFIKGKRDGLIQFNPPSTPPPRDSLCPSCGQPTGSIGLCSFCKMMKRP